jgi:hypothetical protein
VRFKTILIFKKLFCDNQGVNNTGEIMRKFILSLTFLIHIGAYAGEPDNITGNITSNLGAAVDNNSDKAASSKMTNIRVGTGMYMPTSDKISNVNPSISQYRATRNYRAGYYVSYSKSDGGNFKLASISNIREPVTDFLNQEVLYFSPDLGFVEPDYRNFIPALNYVRMSEENEMLCWTGAMRNRDNNAMLDYNPCESSLTTKKIINIGNTAVTAIFTLGVSALAGTSNRNVFVDKDKVISLIRETSTIDALHNWIANKRSTDKLATYRAVFNNARTAAAIDAAVRQYSNDDPDSLIPVAQAKREKMIEEENQRAILEQQRAAALNLQREKEKAKLSATIRKTGAHVCRTAQGTTTQILGYALGNPILEKSGTHRIFYIEGYVDLVNENRLKITVTSITAPRLNQSGIESFNELPPTYTKGLSLWQEFEEWRPCSRDG